MWTCTSNFFLIPYIIQKIICTRKKWKLIYFVTDYDRIITLYVKNSFYLYMYIHVDFVWHLLEFMKNEWGVHEEMTTVGRKWLLIQKNMYSYYKVHFLLDITITCILSWLKPLITYKLWEVSKEINLYMVFLFR